jgi:tetratricopeptide (TPR) repeat protein
MRLRTKIIMALLIGALGLMMHGCAVQQAAGKHLFALKQDVRGNYYLKNGRYQDGIKAFQEEAKVNSDSAETHYYLGRFRLASDNSAMALNHLKRAVKLSPDEADYHFWLGVAYGVRKEADREKQCYLRALELDKNHLQALTYLGHNHFEKKEFSEALKIYQKVLEQWPENPGALFNQALILKRYGRTPEEKLAWREYLGYYPAGAMARQAVGNLNALGNFEYRNHLIGSRTLTLEKIYFEPFSSRIWSGSYPSLNVLGEILKNNQSVAIHIVAYQKNNKELAEGRAKSVKKYLVKHFPEVRASRVMVSWFGVSEKIQSGKNVFTEDECINIITAVERVKGIKSVSNRKK